MAPAGAEYERLASQYPHEIATAVTSESSPRDSIYWQSSVDLAKRGPLDSSYWRKNMEWPVLFSDAIQTLVTREDTKVDVFIEIGLTVF